LACALYILDLDIKKESIKQFSQKRNVKCGSGRTDLFRSRGAKHDGMFSADEHFILYAHAETMKVRWELRIGWYVYALI